MPFSNCYAITRSDRNKVKCQSDARGWQQALNSKVQIHQQNNLKTIKCRQNKTPFKYPAIFFSNLLPSTFFSPPHRNKKSWPWLSSDRFKKEFCKTLSLHSRCFDNLSWWICIGNTNPLLWELIHCRYWFLKTDCRFIANEGIIVF